MSFKATPEEVRFLMIDPKMLELSDYEGIPHLLLPVVTNPKKAAAALRWLVEEMERRYTVLAEKGVRNIEHYHQRMERELKEKGKIYKRKGDVLEGDEEKVSEPMEKIPYIGVVIDELADLMMISSKDVEESITRLAQMSRAVGIHLLLATQRPSVDRAYWDHQGKLSCADFLSGYLSKWIPEPSWTPSGQNICLEPAICSFSRPAVRN